MILECFPCGPIETNGYFVACEKTKRAIIIDAPLGITEIALKNPYHFEKVILTHSHWDHILDLSVLKKKLNLPVYLHEADADNIRNPGSDGLGRNFPFEPVQPDGYLQEGDRITVGEISMQVIHTPGHTPGGICLYIEKESSLISGDTLFCGCMGRIDLPTGDPEAMWRSLKKLAKLPSGTVVYPGHGGPTTIGNENWMMHAKEQFG